MLKYYLAASIVFAGICAQAQNLSFNTNASIEMVSATFKPAEAYIVSSQTQWRSGDFALQTDVSISASYDAAIFATPNSPTYTGEYAIFGFHAALAKSESFRFGGFATLAFPASDVSNQTMSIGAEAMLRFQQIDFEVAAALEVPLNYQQPYQSGNLFFAAYYEIIPQIEISLESFSWRSDLGAISQFTLASANIKYTLPNVPISLKIGLQKSYTTWRAALTSIKFGLSYDFGTPSSARPFGRRGLDFFPVAVALRS